MPPRKPNYKFDRMERDRAKAAKKAAKARAKSENAEANREDVPAEPAEDGKPGQGVE